MVDPTALRLPQSEKNLEEPDVRHVAKLFRIGLDSMSQVSPERNIAAQRFDLQIISIRRCLTTSPMLIRPASLSFSITAKWRVRRSVITFMTSAMVSWGEQR
jgi:hypothetical protein